MNSDWAPPGPVAGETAEAADAAAGAIEDTVPLEGVEEADTGSPLAGETAPPSAPWIAAAALSAPVMSPDSTDCSRLIRLLPKELPWPPSPPGGGGGGCMPAP